MLPVVVPGERIERVLAGWRLRHVRIVAHRRRGDPTRAVGTDTFRST
jgi:hypothetical protein